MAPPADRARSRRVSLPGSRVLTVRHIRRDDRAGLKALYDSLGENDRYMRFFTGHGPPKKLVDDMTRLERKGGVGLVAVIDAPGAESRVVGEATFGLLPNGNGELGITVARDERGWLGPYLLDALVEEAAARGVPNLEAQVMVMNHPMMSLLRHRGLAHVDYADPAIAHVAISTRGRVPGWPPVRKQPRVLVEVQGGHWRSENALREAGFEVLSCPGPRGGWERCPALHGEPCPLVEGADLVIDAVPGEAGAALLHAHRAVHPTVPVCLVVADGAGEPDGDGDGDGDGDSSSPEQISRKAGDPVVVGIVQRLARSRGLAPRPADR